MTDDTSERGYWIVNQTNLAAMLQRVADGDSPVVVMAEEFANCDHEMLARLQPAVPPVQHVISVVYSGAASLQDDAWMIRFRCDQPGCLSGSFTVSPTRSADPLLELIRAGHAAQEQP